MQSPEFKLPYRYVILLFHLIIFPFTTNCINPRFTKGVFLFDGSIDSATGKRFTYGFDSLCQEHPELPTHGAISPFIKIPPYNMRDILLNAFSEKFASNVLADESTILWTILQAAEIEWLGLIESNELLMTMEMRCTLEITERVLLNGLKEEVSVIESLRLLKESLQIIKAKKGWKLPPGNSQIPNQTALDLETGFQDLIQRYEAISLRSGRRLQMFAALVAIEESKRAISQNTKIR